MSIKELSQLYWLDREIEHDEKRLAELNEQLEPKSPKYDGMPKGDGPPASRVEALAAEMTDLSAIIAAKQIQRIHEKQRLERFIDGIKDSYIRLIFKCRFMDCMTWAEVAHAVGGNGCSEDSVKKRCYRYLAQTNTNKGRDGKHGKK